MRLCIPLLRPPQQVAASVHVANKTRLHLYWLHCVSVVCCRSPGVLFLPILNGSLFHFWQKWHISHPTEEDCCFCLIDMSKCAIKYATFGV